MKEINSKDFIQDVLSHTLPTVVLFYNSESADKDKLDFVNVLNIYEEKVPKLKVFSYDISVESNEQLAGHLGVHNQTTLVVFKGGNINRWIDAKENNKITNKDLLKFLGSPVNYGMSKQLATEVLEEIKETLSAKKVKKEKVKVV